MNTPVASLICLCGIAGLFYLNRDNAVETSKALWLPIVYLLILGSRPVSLWLGTNSAVSVRPAAGISSQLDGSPFDATVFGILSLGAIAVLVWRGKRARLLYTSNWPILVYILYCLVSVAWSFHPDVAFKRWIKAIGDPAMCFVILTDRQPIEALRRLISRVGFVLLPTSLLLIKYYPNLGVSYTVDGDRTITGVTTDKNMLGVMLFVVSLFTLWRVIGLLRAKGEPDRGRKLLAQSILLAFGVVLLERANSKTSIACFVLGGALMYVTNLRSIRSRRSRVHLVCLAVFLIGGLSLLLGGSDVARALGRKGNLSGRTEIWGALVPCVPNAIIGAGFESFWISPNVLRFQETLRALGWWHPEVLNEAHDGYLEVYLNLGCVGFCLIALILLDGYKRAVRAFRWDPSIGSLFLTYIITSAFYNITEAGFRMLDLMWVFLLVAVVGASGVAVHLVADRATATSHSRRAMRASRATQVNAFHNKRGIALPRSD